jgi:DNA-binding HxlR family transcriptional regulator
MPEMSKYEKSIIVSNLLVTDLDVVHAASKIFNRVFTTAEISVRLTSQVSDNCLYDSLRRLEDKEIFFVDKQSNKKLIIRFTEKGRSLCRLVKDRVSANKESKILEPSLF